LTPSKIGGLNGIESLDASQMARFVAGLDIPTATQVLASDADNDGILTSYDAVLIARYVAGLPDFGIVTTWKFLPATRTYPALGANQTGQDFAAILVGETTGNWAAAGPMGPESAAEPTESENPQPSSGVTVTLPRIKAPVGANITIPVKVDDLTGRGVRAVDLQVSFDPTLLRPQAVPFDTTGTLTSGMIITPNAANDGHLILSAFQTTDIAGTGTLINLKFTVVGTAGQLAYLSFENYADPNLLVHPAVRFNSGELPAATIKGTVQIGPSTSTDSISGRVMTAEGQPIRNAVVTLRGNSLGTPLKATTDSFGYYWFSGLTAGETYVVTATSQRFTFTAPSRVVSLTDNVFDANFVAGH
jgi:hypothetical protein